MSNSEPRGVSPVYQRFRRFADSPAGLVAAFSWGVAEAWSWPVIAEMELALLGAVTPRNALRHSIAVTTGSVAGVVTHVWLRRHGVALPLPWTTPRMHAAAAQQLRDDGARRAFWQQQLSGIPVKVYAAQAAQTDLPLLHIAAASGWARGCRIIGVGVASSGLGAALRPLAERRWGVWVGCSVGAWAVGQRRVLASWR